MRRSSLVGAQVTEEDRLRCPICVLDRLRHFNGAVGWHRHRVNFRVLVQFTLFYTVTAPLVAGAL